MDGCAAHALRRITGGGERESSTTWARILAMLAVASIMLNGCGRLGPAPTATIVPVGLPSSTMAPAATSTAQSSPSATPTEVAEVTPEATPSVIPHFERGTQVEIHAVQMIDSLAGWGIARDGAAEDHVLTSADGGRTWVDVTPPESAALRPPQESTAVMFFLDAQQGWVAYFVGPVESVPLRIHFWHTADGGRSWDRGPTFDSTGQPETPPILHFSDASTGWLLLEQFVGMGHHAFTLLRTQDGGRSWQQLAGTTETESTCHRTGLSFSDPSRGWMTGECPFEVGEGASLEVSDDGGSTWKIVRLPPPGQAQDLFQTAATCSARSPRLFTPETGALVVTCSLEGAGGAKDASFLYITTDGGVSWRTSDFPGGEPYFLDSTRGWALSKDLYWTQDGGVSWTKIKTVEWEGQFSFVNAQLGWAVARHEDEIALVMTTDGGRTWEILQPVISP